ncbi:MAG: hypothetical protein C4547_16030 [Phycisphaerales bacterium]|nr:MAG: hypothetical protein C4547_16030 [Phycisphaerales bacterium]
MFVGAASAPAGEVLDQQSPVGNTGFNGSSDTLTWQQEVNVGIAGLLSRVEVNINNPGRADFFINVGPPWQTDPHDFSIILEANVRDWVSVDVSSANIQLDVGDRFVIGIKGRNENLGFTGSGFPGLYDRGELYLNGNVYVGPNQFDIAFRTWMLEGGGCSGEEKLSASCKRGTVKGKLKKGTPGNTYTFCLDGGDCQPTNANNRGKAKIKYRDVAPGRHEVTVKECGLSADVDC